VRERTQKPNRHRIRRLLLLVLVCLLGGYAALPFLGSLPALHRWIEARIGAATGYEVRFNDMQLSHDLTAEIVGLSVAAPGETAFLTAARLHASPHLPGLPRGSAGGIRVEGVHLFPERIPTPPSGRVDQGETRRDATSVTDLPSGTTLAASLHGQRIELVDGFLHFGTEADGVLGPIGVTIDSLDLDRGLHLSGNAALGTGGSEAQWSAELGASLADSTAEIRADAAFDDLVRSWSDIVLPAPLQGIEGSLALGLQGTDDTHVAVDITAELRPPGASRTLPVRGSGEIDLGAGTAAAKLSARGIEFQAADASRAASGLKLDASLHAQRGKSGANRLDFTVAVPAGEVLWERYYLDLTQHRLEVRGRLEPGTTAMKLSRAALSAGGIGSLRGGGTWDTAGARSQWQGDFDLPGLDALFRLAVRDPFSEGRPILAGIDVAGRALGSVALSTDAAGARRITGTLDLADAAITVADPRMQLNGVDLHLPLDFQEADSAAGPAQSGWLRLATVSVGDVDMDRVVLPLEVVTNRIGIAEPVRIGLFGGSVDLTAFHAEALASAAPRVTVGVALRDLDLEPLALAAGLPQMVGRVTGAIPNLTLEGNAIRSEGEIRIEVFDGTLRLRNLQLDEMSSPVPALRLDLDFADISLKQLTRTFEVGRISGILGGRVDRLVLVDGQPVSFEAQVATTPRSGVSQRISVRAIRQISILGGSGGDPLSQGVLGLFDEYRYAKMGFRSRLENDRFELHGIEESSGQEYLVVGATLPPRVSVVSHTRVIAFSELVRRLGRVATVEETAPPDEAPVEAPDEADQEPGKGRT
jgi:hypothetical protein